MVRIKTTVFADEDVGVIGGVLVVDCCQNQDNSLFCSQGITMRKMTVTLHQDEREALITLAERERRDPHQQAALCIRRELERRGLLQTADQQAQGNGSDQVE